MLTKIQLEKRIVETIFQFPSLGTLREKLFGISQVVNIDSSTCSGRLRVWMGSFDLVREDLSKRQVEVANAYGNEHYERIASSFLESPYVKALSHKYWKQGLSVSESRELIEVELMDEIRREAASNRPVTLLTKAIDDLGKSYVVSSLFDSMMFLGVLSMGNRILELTFLTLRQKLCSLMSISNTNFLKKALMDLVQCYLQYCVLVFAGFAGSELVACKLATLLISAVLPYKYSNWIRQMDELSNSKVFQLKDFIVKNMVVMMRNLFAVHIFNWYMSQFWEIFNDRNFLLNANHFHYRDDHAEISAFTIKEDNIFYIGGFNNYSVKGLAYLTNEFGWMFGKILVDMMCIILLKYKGVEDLRDPFNTDAKPKIALRKKMQQALTQKNDKVVVKDLTKVHHYDIENDSSSSSNLSHDSTSTSDLGRRNLKSEVVKEHKHKKTKNKIHGLARAQLENNEEQQERGELTSSFNYMAGDYEYTFIRLSGGICDKMNTWGVIVKKPGKDGFQWTLGSGVIGKGMRFINNKILERRPKSTDARLLGCLHMSNDDYEAASVHEDDNIYNALKDYMPLEDARIVSGLLAEQAEGRERTALVIFSKQAKHSGKDNINRVKEQLERQLI